MRTDDSQVPAPGEAVRLDSSPERLRRLMAELLLAEERERRALASDLHDGLGQTLALVLIRLAGLRGSLDAHGQAALGEIVGLVEQADSSARSVGFELSPPVLHDLGLVAALQWLVENIRTRYGIEVSLSDDGRPKPTDERTRVILFRSVRELLINAARHSGARSVRVRLVGEPGRIEVIVLDDGCGMDTLQCITRGSGLFGIHERIGHIGGSLRVDSLLGRGTSIRLGAPLPRPGPEGAPS